MRQELGAGSTCSWRLTTSRYHSSKGAATSLVPVSYDVFIQRALTAPKDIPCKTLSFKVFSTYVYWRGREPLRRKDWELLIGLEEGALFVKQLFSKYKGRQVNLKHCASQQQLGNSKSRLPLCPWLTLWYPGIARASAQCVVLCIICVAVLINRGANSACLRHHCFIRCASRMNLAKAQMNARILPFVLQVLSSHYPLSCWKWAAQTDLNLFITWQETEMIKGTIKQVLTKMPAASDLHFTHLLQTWFMEELKL